MHIYTVILDRVKSDTIALCFTISDWLRIPFPYSKKEEKRKKVYIFLIPHKLQIKLSHFDLRNLNIKTC